MSYKVIPTPVFKRLFKRLAKKHPSLQSDLRELVASLKEQPEQGTSLGNQVYKIRLAITSTGKGKSGGARVITFLVNPHKEVYLLHIYTKGELDSLSKAQIIDLLKATGLSEMI